MSVVVTHPHPTTQRVPQGVDVSSMSSLRAPVGSEGSLSPPRALTPRYEVVKVDEFVFV
jgi:hypothetical protein